MTATHYYRFKLFFYELDYKYVLCDNEHYDLKTLKQK